MMRSDDCWPARRGARVVADKTASVVPVARISRAKLPRVTVTVSESSLLPVAVRMWPNTPRAGHTADSQKPDTTGEEHGRDLREGPTSAR